MAPSFSAPSFSTFVQGIVTLEDVVETLLGFEIVDEGDETPNLRKLARQRWEERRRELIIDS